MCVERTLTPLCQVNSFSIQMSQRNCRQFLNSLSQLPAHTRWNHPCCCGLPTICQIDLWHFIHLHFARSLMRLQSKRGKHWSLPFRQRTLTIQYFAVYFPNACDHFVSLCLCSMVCATLLLILLQLIYDFPHINRPKLGGTLSGCSSLAVH